MIGCGERDLYPITGGKDDGFRRTQILEFVQSIRQEVFCNRQFFPQID